LDTARNIYVANFGGNDILIFAAGAAGNAAPVAAIGGANTGLAGPNGIAFDIGGALYVANDAGSITVYAPKAVGNAAPIRTIAGARTTLIEPLGVALDSSKRIYVIDANDRVVIFGPAANGNVVPAAVIAGNLTMLNGASGIAVSELKGPTPTPTPQPLVPSIGSVPSVLHVGTTFNVNGLNFTAGSVLNFFVATSSGAVNVGPFTPIAASATQLTFELPLATPLGQGFASVRVINTDQGFTQSNLAYALLQGNAAPESRPSPVSTVWSWPTPAAIRTMRPTTSRPSWRKARP
jgi:hypothetical protein